MTLTSEPALLTSTQTALLQGDAFDSVCVKKSELLRGRESQPGLLRLGRGGLGGGLTVGVRGHEFKEVPSTVPST